MITTTAMLATLAKTSVKRSPSEDVRHHSFCITIDRESEAELKDLYATSVIDLDDVLSLPERMPNIYRRLTISEHQHQRCGLISQGKRPWYPK